MEFFIGLNANESRPYYNILTSSPYSPHSAHQTSSAGKQDPVNDCIYSVIQVEDCDPAGSLASHNGAFIARCP